MADDHPGGGDADRRSLTPKGPSDAPRAPYLASMAGVLMDASEVPVIGCDTEGTIVVWSTAAERQYCYPASEVTGQPFSVILPEEELELLGNICERVAAGEIVGGVRATTVSREGARVPVSLTVAPMVADDGEILGTLALARDLTELDAVQAAHAMSEDRFRLLADNARDLIFRYRLTPDHLGFDYVSPSCQELSGYTTEELYADPKLIDVIVDPPSLAHIREGVRGRTLDGQRLEFPLHRKDGTIVWVEATFRVTHDQASGRPVAVEAIMRDVSEAKIFQSEMARLAVTDSLTGLPNRVLLDDRLTGALARAQRGGDWVGVYLVDIDRFAMVNDSLGIAAGDQLLRAVAERLSGSVRAADTVARFGGDEYVVVSEGFVSPESALLYGQKLTRLLDRPFEVAGTEVRLTASVGVAMSRDYSKRDTLVRDADAAMRVAKVRGRARVEVFEESMHADAGSRLGTGTELRRAMELGEMVLHYQPVIRLKDHEIVGLEALSRWDHPIRGLLYPSEFMPVAEEMGVSVPLGAWVFDEACRQAAVWAGQGGPSVGISVNVSARQLNNPDFVEWVSEVIERHGLEAGHLTLDVTEGDVTAEVDSVLEVLGRLRRLGLHLALDDSRGSFSSLSFLKHLPVDRLKIDVSMVSGVGEDDHDNAVAAAILAMASALGLEVVVTHVERQGQVAALAELGFWAAQGYVLAPPATAEELSGLVATEA